MNLSMMILLHDYFHGAAAGPSAPRPADPSPEGGEGEPVGDDDDEPVEEHGDSDGRGPDESAR